MRDFAGGESAGGESAAAVGGVPRDPTNVSVADRLALESNDKRDETLGTKMTNVILELVIG
jgi:hypothetical protein